MKILTALFLSLLLFSNAGAQERYVKFVDEAGKDPSFKAFRARLIEAVQRKDVDFLISSLDPKIEVSFGGDNGIADFKRFWKLDSPDSPLWSELLTVLSNGGYLSNDGGVTRFAAPYTFEGFPEDMDAFVYDVIFGNAVALREKPSLDGKVITRLSYNIVVMDYDRSVTSGDSDNPTVLWAYVKTLGGKKGFVSGQYVRSPIEYRAMFEKRRGKWKMTAFVDGD